MEELTFQNQSINTFYEISTVDLEELNASPRARVQKVLLSRPSKCFSIVHLNDIHNNYRPSTRNSYHCHDRKHASLFCKGSAEHQPSLPWISRSSTHVPARASSRCFSIVHQNALMDALLTKRFDRLLYRPSTRFDGLKGFFIVHQNARSVPWISRSSTHVPARASSRCFFAICVCV